MLLYYITDRRQFPGNDVEQRRQLLGKIAEASAAGVDYIQLRERDLPTRELERLAQQAADAVRSSGKTTRLLINSRVDVALAVGAHGVHLRSDDISASDARAIAAARSEFVVAVSCHNQEEIRWAWSHGADFAVLAPIFEKGTQAGMGIDELRKCCAQTPKFVVALGGITPANMRSCFRAGAMGVAGIRLFQDSNIGTLVESLRTTVQNPE
jgi:thiamine-phosphate pyrophosphorylase